MTRQISFYPILGTKENTYDSFNRKVTKLLGIIPHSEILSYKSNLMP